MLERKLHTRIRKNTNARAMLFDAKPALRSMLAIVLMIAMAMGTVAFAQETTTAPEASPAPTVVPTKEPTPEPSATPEVTASPVPENVYVPHYPMLYKSTIIYHAEKRGLDPAYVAAIIMAESGFDPEAVSAVGARGLMQLMPETGEWIAGKFGEDFKKKYLFEPERNIKYGCWYLGFLHKTYNGDPAICAVAYHAGQGTVDRWLKDPKYSDDGVTLKEIPFDSTNAYVKSVLEFYEAYKIKYAQ